MGMKNSKSYIYGFSAFWVPAFYLLLDPLRGRYYWSADTSHLFYVLKRWFWEKVKSGDWPVWNDGLFGGIYQLASPAHEIFSPLTSPFYWLFSGYEAMIASLVLGIGLAGLGTFLLAKSWGASSSLSLTMAWIYAFCGPFLSLVDRSPIFMALAIYPWLAWWLNSFFSGPTLGKLCGLASLTALLVHHGDWIGALFWLGIFMMVFGYRKYECLKNGQKMNIVSGLGSALLLVVLTWGLSAIILLPVGDNLSFTQRASGFSYEQVSYYSLHPLRLFSLAVPELWGQFYGGSFWGQNITSSYHAERFWYHSLYFGMIPMIIFGWYLWENRQNRKLWLSCGLALLVLGLSLGKYFYVHQWLYEYSSTYAKLRYPEKFVLYPLLVALAVSFWFWSKKESQENELEKYLYLAVGGLHLIVAVISLSLLPSPENLQGQLHLSALVRDRVAESLSHARIAHLGLGILGLSIFFGFRSGILPRIFRGSSPLLPGFVLLEMVLFAPAQNTISSQVLAQPSRLSKAVNHHKDPTHFRILRDGNLDHLAPNAFRDTWAPNWSLLDDIQMTFGYETITPDRTERLVGAETMRNLNQWAPIFNIKYVISTIEPREKNLKKYFEEEKLTPVGMAKNLNTVVLALKRESHELDFATKIQLVSNEDESFLE